MILDDAHVVVWLTFEPDRISRGARTAIEVARRNAEALAICDVTLLEIARVTTGGQIRTDLSVESLLQEVEARFVVLPMNSRVCARAIDLPATFPRDPADRIIVATSLVEGMPLITADRDIRRSKVVATIW